jgi:hypothetical protein
MEKIMITEDYVSFETAKLLKKKGFNYPCRVIYSPKGIVKHYLKEEVYAHHLKGHKKLCPTLQMAMKWLREVHKLYVEVVPNPFNFEHQDIQDGWGCEVTHLSDLSYDGNYEFFQKKYSTYEEACEAAIKYCLENLI